MNDIDRKIDELLALHMPIDANHANDAKAIKSGFLALVNEAREAEWDIANEAVLKNAHIISDEEDKLEALALVNPSAYNAKVGDHLARAFGYDICFQPFSTARSKRIAELKQGKTL